MKRLLVLLLLCLKVAAEAENMPAVWGMDFAPESYWAQLEATMAEYGVTPENLEGKKQEWLAEYGDEFHWPQDLLVITDMLEMTSQDLEQEGAITYAVFSSEDKVPQETIRDIAWTYLSNRLDGKTEEDWRTYCWACLYANLVDPSDPECVYAEPVWLVSFIE